MCTPTSVPSTNVNDESKLGDLTFMKARKAEDCGSDDLVKSYESHLTERKNRVKGM